MLHLFEVYFEYGHRENGWRATDTFVILSPSMEDALATAGSLLRRRFGDAEPYQIGSVHLRFKNAKLSDAAIEAITLGHFENGVEGAVVEQN